MCIYDSLFSLCSNFVGVREFDDILMDVKEIDK